MTFLKHITGDFINLLFPNLCSACGTLLYPGEKEICTQCLYELPYTDFHLYAENKASKQLWGRIPCNAVMALLYFKKASRVQNLIHSLKYKNQTATGSLLGNMIGERLLISDAYKTVDLIIPVPLHPRKEKSRGYNQSKCIAEGIANVLKVPVYDQALIRANVTESQTKKSRYKRFENMKSVFKVVNAPHITQKHVLLVDDVITTGSTLEACGTALLNYGVAQLSIAAVAFTE